MRQSHRQRCNSNSGLLSRLSAHKLSTFHTSPSKFLGSLLIKRNTGIQVIHTLLRMTNRLSPLMVDVIFAPIPGSLHSISVPAAVPRAVEGQIVHESGKKGYRINTPLYQVNDSGEFWSMTVRNWWYQYPSFLLLKLENCDSWHHDAPLLANLTPLSHFSTFLPVQENLFSIS